MKEFLKQNLTLVLAFLLPVLLITAIALGTYLPSLLLSTNYNFIYATCASNDHTCSKYLQNRYTVVDGKLEINDAPLIIDSNNKLDKELKFTSRIFVHDTKKNESREITLEEAQALTLNNLLTSPDGVSVSGDYSRGADFLFLFNGGSSYGYYLMKGNSKSKLSLINSNDQYYYRNNFHFIGWVTPGRN